jgi:hypothetical protein
VTGVRRVDLLVPVGGTVEHPLFEERPHLVAERLVGDRVVVRVLPLRGDEPSLALAVLEGMLLRDLDAAAARAKAGAA